MKIAVYGISCAGKDTFISRFTEKFSKFTHIKGSTKLNELSGRMYGCKFRLLDQKKQGLIRKKFITQLTESDEIIVDGHYCFPNGDSYKIAFTDSDMKMYDIFLYLRAKPTIVVERMKSSEKNMEYNSLNVDDIEKWQRKEIAEMRDVCFKNRKEFVVLDEDFDADLLFLSEYFSRYPKMTALKTAERIAQKIIEKNSNTKQIALFDCDRTIIEEDATVSFFEMNNREYKLLKEIFCGDIYSVYQFWRQNRLFKDLSIFPKIRSFHFNKPVTDKLQSLKEQGFKAYGLTAGIYKIWNEISFANKLFDAVIGNNLEDGFSDIITDFVKGYIVILLQKQGYKVFAVGDSMCDIYMIELASGYIWAPGKIREPVQNYLKTHSNTSIKQFKENIHKYEGIKEEE